jgi:hypothetical protein
MRLSSQRKLVFFRYGLKSTPKFRTRTFSDVPAGVLDGGVAIHVGQLAEAKSEEEKNSRFPTM